MKIVITGVAGFIGSSIAKKLLQKGIHIIGLDNLNNYYSKKLKLARLYELKSDKKFSFVETDLQKRFQVKEKNIDFVLHFAAQAGVRLPLDTINKYVDSNIYAFKHALDLCLRLSCNNFVYASSSSVYSGNIMMPLKESDQLMQPKNFYAYTKIYNEVMAEKYAREYGINATGLRFFTVYGPWGRPDMAYYSFTKKVLNKEQIELYNEGNLSRDMTYIDDVVYGIQSLISKYEALKSINVLNLGNSKPIKTIQIVKEIEQYFNSKAKIIYKDKPNEVHDTLSDISLAKQVINYDPQIDFKDGIKDFFKWFRSYNG